MTAWLAAHWLGLLCWSLAGGVVGFFVYSVGYIRGFRDAERLHTDRLVAASVQKARRELGRRGIVVKP